MSQFTQIALDHYKTGHYGPSVTKYIALLAISTFWFSGSVLVAMALNWYLSHSRKSKL
jgi:hypothetical protein